MQLSYSDSDEAHFQDDNKGKKRKRDRVRPILHNKEEQSPLADEVTDSPPANHFAESQPKDDVMLKRRISVSLGTNSTCLVVL